MARPAIRAAVFDLDDTLYPEWQFVLGGFRAAADLLASVTGLSQQQLVKRMIQLFRQDRRAVFDRLLALPEVRCSLGDNAISSGWLPEMVDTLVSCYREHKPRLRLFPDAARVLPLLRSRGVLLALVTDGCAVVQRTKVRALQLDTLLDAVVYTDELAPGREAWKPASDGFKRVTQLLHVEPCEAAYIGDNVYKDFQGAAAIGMRTVRVLRPGGFYAHEMPPSGLWPEWTIISLDDLVDLFDWQHAAGALGSTGGR